MFEKYSNSRDLMYSIIFVIVIAFFGFLIKFKFLEFNTNSLSYSLLQVFGVFFVFILTIITIMFMFDYKKSPIFRKLENDNLFNQIFKRFFDSLIVISFSLVFFLIISIYFDNLSIITFQIWKIIFNLEVIINFIILTLISLSSIRLSRCLKLLHLIYKSINYKEKD